MTKKLFYFTVGSSILCIVDSNVILILMINTFMIGIDGVYKEITKLVVIFIILFQTEIYSLLLLWIISTDTSSKVLLLLILCFLIIDSSYTSLSILYFYLKNRISYLLEVPINNIEMN